MIGAQKSIDSIIETSTMNVSPDTKKIAVSFASGLEVGNLIYWDRVKSYWLVYYQRITEKNYFSGEMQLAKYQIHWMSPGGKKYMTWGSVRNQTSGLHGLSSYFETISGDIELLIPRVEGSEYLVRQTRIKLNGRTYKITGSNDTNHENIIIFYLDEVQSNPELDNEIPYGNTPMSIELESTLNNIDSITLGTTLDFKITTRKDGLEIDDKYEIICTDCVHNNNAIEFNSLGVAQIKVYSELTDNILDLEIEVISEETSNYYIDGPASVRTMLSYSYTAKINGELRWTLVDNNENELSKDIAKIEETKDGEITIKTGSTVTEFTIVAETNSMTLRKVVNIKPLY